MTPDEAGLIAEEFLARSGGSKKVAVRVESLCAGRGFLVFYQDPRAVAGDSRYELLGNVPVMIRALTKEAALCGFPADDFKSVAEEWINSGPKP